MKLKIVGITKKYHNLTALDHIDLELHNGIYGLIGPNGAGKSTLMRLLAGELRPTSGNIFWNGKDIFKLDEKYKRYIGYLPQTFGFYKEFTGYEMLCYIGLLKSKDNIKKIRAQAKQLLNMLELSDKADAMTGKYSGGMKQRLGIAQALIGNPRILIMDEPTAGLDPMQRIYFKKKKKKYSSQKIIIVSTHIMSDVQELADHLIFLKKGRVVLDKSRDAALEESADYENLYMRYYAENIPSGETKHGIK